ncbi:MAG: RrF2 family transcriptional regulator [Elusimicrobiales bacterium]
MQITLEADYALRCMVYLKGRGERLSVLGEISSATRIPPAFLSKILQKLIKGGLVLSAKGKNGGFRLAGDPGSVSVYDIMRAVCGGNVLKEVCGRPRNLCKGIKTCKIHLVWRDLCASVRAVLESRKLSGL